MNKRPNPEPKKRMLITIRWADGCEVQFHLSPKRWAAIEAGGADRVRSSFGYERKNYKVTVNFYDRLFAVSGDEGAMYRDDEPLEELVAEEVH